jgi:hypothetical protein
LSRKLWTTVLVVVGLLLVARGYQRWSTAQGPSAAVADFLGALRAGDRDRAFDLLDPARRGLARKRLEEDIAPWTPAPQLKFEIEEMQVDGDRATARVLLTESGFKLRPVIALQRSEFGLWEIGEITHLDTDPRWNRIQAERAAAECQARQIADDELAEQLAQALEQAPGVIVSREIPEAPARR